MKPQDAESTARRHLRAVGRTEDEDYRLAIDELLKLVDHSTRLNGLRLELLRALQSALPSSDEPGLVADLKELLTDLIIMQSRLAGREERLQGLLRQIGNSQALDHVSVGEASLKEAILDILQASAHVRSIAGDEG